jgi:hypothetical protein
MWQPHEWSFTLGVNNGGNAIAADWAVQLRLTDSTAQVSTTHYLTKDDVLVHGEQHDVLRNEILRALSLGKMEDPECETELAHASLGRRQEFARPARAPVTVDFALRTKLEPQSAWARLNLVGHRLLQRDERQGVWGLGLPAYDDTDRVSIHVGPDRLTGRAVIASEPTLARRAAEAGLLSFIARARFLLGREDPDLHYEGPDEWATGPVL